jgi:hypothetical protein
MVFTPAWQDLKLGEGGNAYKIHFYADGTLLCCADTNGSFIYEPTGSIPYYSDPNSIPWTPPVWRQLFTTVSLNFDSYYGGNLTEEILSDQNYGGCEAVAAPSNTSVLYGLWKNYAWVSTDRGLHWVRTPLTDNFRGNGNSLQRPQVTVDPNNPDICFISTHSNGCFKTINGRAGASSSWAKVTAVGNGATGGSDCDGHIVTYDPNSSVVGGVTQRFCIHTNNTGTYETTNGGTSFSLVASSPPLLTVLLCDKYSQFWGLTPDNDPGGQGRLYRRTTGAWALLNSAMQINSLAIDPTSASQAANRLVGLKFDGSPFISTNNGTSWTGYGQAYLKFTAPAGQPDWINRANTNNDFYLSLVDCIIDNSAVLWVASGIGIFKVPVSSIGNPAKVSLVADTSGIEQLVINRIVCPPNNGIVTAVWDRGIVHNHHPDDYASSQYSNNTEPAINPINHGWGVDYAKDDTNFIVACTDYQPIYSTDGGNSWLHWPSIPSGYGQWQRVMVSTKLNWVTCSGFGSPFYTLDGGVTWAACNTSGASFGYGNNGWIKWTADQVAPGVFYAMDNNTNNIYRSVNGGATFTQVGVLPPGNPWAGYDVNWYPQLISVPGNDGHLFFNPGIQTDRTRGNIWRSTNRGATWTLLDNNLNCISSIGLGAPKPGGSGYPTLYVHGHYSSVLSMYASFDQGATWSGVNIPSGLKKYPGNLVNQSDGQLVGDPNVYGRIYIGYGAPGAGIAYVDTADACPHVNFYNIKPRDTLTGIVNLTAKLSGQAVPTSVQFAIDSTNIGAPQSGAGPSYTVSFNAGSVSAGAHLLKVTSTNATGNTVFQIPVTTAGGGAAAYTLACVKGQFLLNGVAASLMKILPLPPIHFRYRKI